MGAALALAAIVLIILPATRHGGVATPGLLAADPEIFVPRAQDLPIGTQMSSHNSVLTESAVKNNGTPLGLLRRTGREIGYDGDFLVPAYGDIEVEVVRYRTHRGLSQAYDYFLKMPAERGLRAVPVNRLGEQAVLVVGNGGVFIEFLRDRYYVVVTAVPATGPSLKFISQLSQSVDRPIRDFDASA